MQPLKRPFRVSRISAGSRQLLVGPASASLCGADEGAVLDPGDVAGVGEREVGVRPLGVGEALEGAGVDQRLGERVVLLRRPVAPVDGVGLGQACRSPRPSRGALRAWSARWPRWFGSSCAALYLLGLSSSVGLPGATISRSASSLTIRRVTFDRCPSLFFTVQSNFLPFSTSTSEGQSTEATLTSPRSYSAFAVPRSWSRRAGLPRSRRAAARGGRGGRRRQAPRGATWAEVSQADRWIGFPAADALLRVRGPENRRAGGDPRHRVRLLQDGRGGARRRRGDRRADGDQVPGAERRPDEGRRRQVRRHPRGGRRARRGDPGAGDQRPDAARRPRRPEGRGQAGVLRRASSGTGPRSGR